MQDQEFRDLIETVRERTNIVDVVSQYVTLDRNLKARCPFDGHDDKIPSFSINTEKQIFKCFGCGKGGDVFTFLMEREGWLFWEALSHLAEKAGVELPTFSPEAKQQIRKDRVQGEILEATTAYYEDQLKKNAAAIDYLRGRGFTDEIISQFRVGYADGRLRKYLQDRDFELDDIEGTGLVEKGRDFLDQRLTFPYTRRGRVITIRGRRFPDSPDKPRKCMGPRNHPLQLFNIDALRNPSGHILVCEGETDTLSAVQLGYTAVGIPGVNGFNKDWIDLFPNDIPLISCLDQDDAGQNGTARLIEHLGPLARVLLLPSGLDVNDFVQEYSSDDFRALVEKAPSWLDLQFDRVIAIPENTRPPETRELFEKVAGLDPYERPRFLGRLQEISGFTKAETRAEIERLANQKAGERDASISPSVNPGTHKKDATYTACFDGLVELVEDDGEPAFLVKDRDNLSILKQIERDGQIFIPPPAEQIPWLLPRGKHALEYFQTDTDDLLFDDLLAYHKGVSDLPSEDYYSLIATWVFHTYLQETVQYSPIICLFAVPERGKSRTGKAMIHLARRGIHVESLREAYLLRVAHDLGASVFFDVKDVWKKAEKNQSEDILLHRFEKGAKVARVLYPDRGAHQDMKFYRIFGPTIMGTNEGVHKILGTRAIQICMPEARRNFENDVRPECGLPYKERLVAFRARHLGEELPAAPKPAVGRLGDILKPLLQIIRLVRPDEEGKFLNLVRELEIERQIEKAETLEAQILLTVSEMADQVEGGMLRIKEITNRFNQDKPEKLQITYRRVGGRLKAMGFKKVRASDGAFAILWDDIKIEQMKDKYGLRQRSERSESPGNPQNLPEHSEGTEHSERLQIPF